MRWDTLVWLGVFALFSIVERLKCRRFSGESDCLLPAIYHCVYFAMLLWLIGKLMIKIVLTFNNCLLINRQFPHSAAL